jgi:hypothetical protein
MVGTILSLLASGGLGAAANILAEQEKKRQSEEAAGKIKQANKMRQLYDFGNARYEQEMAPYVSAGPIAAGIQGAAGGLGLGQSIAQSLGQMGGARTDLNADQAVQNVLSTDIPQAIKLLQAPQLMQPRLKTGLGFSMAGRK